MIGLPPSELGAIKLTVACALPLVAVPITGAPGTVAGATGSDGVDAAPVPKPLVAVTVKVYAIPLVKPVTAIGLDVPVVVGCAVVPTYGVTVYLMIGLPPSEGAAKLTSTFVSPGAVVTPVGAPGGPMGVNPDPAVADGPVPIAFCAATVNV